VYDPDKIYTKISHLIKMASIPVLTDISIDINGVSNCEIFPYPIPDLFCGAPLIISGKYEGQFPSQITLSGVFANNESANFKIPSTMSQYVPINKVFIKTRLDLLTAEAWLTNSQQIVDQVVTLSCSEKMPCAHTTMIAYETTTQLSNTHGPKKTSRMLKTLAVGGMAGIIVLGVTMASFGNLAGTLANLSVVQAVQSITHWVQAPQNFIYGGGGNGTGNNNCDCNCGGGSGSNSGGDRNCCAGGHGCCSGCNCDCGGCGSCGSCDCGGCGGCDCGGCDCGGCVVM